MKSTDDEDTEYPESEQGHVDGEFNLEGQESEDWRTRSLMASSSRTTVASRRRDGSYMHWRFLLTSTLA